MHSCDEENAPSGHFASGAGAGFAGKFGHGQNFMIIFEKCHNLTMTFLTQVTDKGLEYLTSIRVLQIHFSKNITGASLKMLHLHHKLWCLNLLDDKKESDYAPDIVTFFRSRQPRFYFRFCLC